MTHRFAGLALLAVLAAGCFPVVVDVNRQGRMLIPREEGVFSVSPKGETGALVTRPRKGLPVWARWSPDGSKVLVAELVGEKAEAELFVVDAAGGGQAKELGKFPGASCALWSPDGARISVAQSGRKGYEIWALDPSDPAARKKLLDSALPAHDWIGTDKLAAFRCVRVDKATGGQWGDLVTVSAADAQATKVASLICERDTVIDASPDGASVLVVAAGKDDKDRLTKVTLADGATVPIGPDGAIAGIWSPDGQRVAIVYRAEVERTTTQGDVPDMPGSDDEGGVVMTFSYSTDVEKLMVGDAQGGALKDVAEDVAAYGMGHGGCLLLPSWTDAHTILFFKQVTVYADVGKALHLMSVKYNGTGLEDLQLAIDSQVAEALK